MKKNRIKSATFGEIQTQMLMEKIVTIASMALITTTLASCGAEPQGETPWIVDRFDDIKVMRYEVPGFAEKVFNKW